MLMVQDWVEGSDETLYSCNCYFDRDSEPLVSFIARKIRQWPPATGTACISVECRNDEVLEESMRLFRSVGYRGLGYLEMKQDSRTGKHYIIEPNIGRPTGRSAISEAGGVELLYTMYCDAVGLPLPTNREQTYRGVKWIAVRRDLQSSFWYWRRGELTAREWWRSIRGRKAYALFSWRDPLPFWADLARCAGILGRARGPESGSEPVEASHSAT
jgi:predicted ATP-grasp superfamily ATP-dependent carboligase